MYRLILPLRARQYISFIIVLAIGIVIGYFLSNGLRSETTPQIVNTHTTDTLVKSEVIEVPVEVETTIKEIDTVFIQPDTIEQISLDTTVFDTVIVQIDTIFNADESIVRDKKISQMKVKLELLSEVEVDTLLEKLLDVKTVNSEHISIEFWESPVNYKGYKLSKSKLIIYGLLPSDDLNLYKKEELYFLKLDGLFYKLTETSVYNNYQPIEKPEFIND